MAAYAKHDGTFFSQRAVFFIAIIFVHIGLVYLFESGLATRIVKVIDAPIQTEIVQEQKKIEAPPPPPPPKLEHPPVEVPPPDVTINMPAPAQTTALSNVTTHHQAPPPPPPPKVVRTRAQPDRKHWPDPGEYYPPTSRRMGETGTATIHFCWDAKGSVTGQPTVAKSSGSSRLDEAAVRYTTHVRMIPGTANGVPEAGCSELPVLFKLTD